MAYAWFILLLAVAGTVFLLLLLHGTPLGRTLHERIPDRPRRRLFVSSAAFFMTFGGVRAVVFAVVHQIPPFHFIQMGRLMSILYGVGAALTLDEFALWLNLKDVYWAREGRSSIDAVILFGAVLAPGSWGAPPFAQ